MNRPSTTSIGGGFASQAVEGQRGPDLHGAVRVVEYSELEVAQVVDDLPVQLELPLVRDRRAERSGERVRRRQHATGHDDPHIS